MFRFAPPRSSSAYHSYIYYYHYHHNVLGLHLLILPTTTDLATPRLTFTPMLRCEIRHAALPEIRIMLRSDLTLIVIDPMPRHWAQSDELMRPRITL